MAVSALGRVCLRPKIAFRSEVTGSGVQTGQRHYSVYTTLAVVSMDWLSIVTDCVPTCIALVRHTRAVNVSVRQTHKGATYACFELWGSKGDLLQTKIHQYPQARRLRTILERRRSTGDGLAVRSQQQNCDGEFLFKYC